MRFGGAWFVISETGKKAEPSGASCSSRGARGVFEGEKRGEVATAKFWRYRSRDGTKRKRRGFVITHTMRGTGWVADRQREGRTKNLRGNKQ